VVYCCCCCSSEYGGYIIWMCFCERERDRDRERDYKWKPVEARYCFHFACFSLTCVFLSLGYA
ncbi:hypothetical protein HN51_031251, partial [Arachis hypogaea]